MYSFSNFEPALFSTSSSVVSWPAYRFLGRQVRWSGIIFDKRSQTPKFGWEMSLGGRISPALAIGREMEARNTLTIRKIRLLFLVDALLQERGWGHLLWMNGDQVARWQEDLLEQDLGRAWEWGDLRNVGGLCHPSAEGTAADDEEFVMETLCVFHLLWQWCAPGIQAAGYQKGALLCFKIPPRGCFEN